MTTDSGTAGPVAASDLVAKAHDLIPFLRAHSAQAEQAATLAPEVLTTLRDAGFFRLTTAAQFGGYDLDLPAQAEAIAAVARGCASAGWVVGAEAASTMFTRGLPAAAQADIFDRRPDALVLSTASITGAEATVTDGGFTISGRFSFATGCEISDWALLLSTPVKDAEEEGLHVSVVVPMSDVTVDRTWNVAGMAGTGTHSIVLDGVFVPEHRVLQYRESDLLLADEDKRTVVTIRACVTTLAALVGAAQGALDAVREMLEANLSISFTNFPAATDSPAVRMWFAEAAHSVDCSVLHMMHVARTLDLLTLDQQITWVERAELRMHISSSLREARSAVDKLLDIGGARGFAMTNPLQRYWRDLLVGSHHATYHAPTILEDYSLALWGKRPAIVNIH